MTFKIEKNVPTRKAYNAFTDTLDKLDVGDSIPGLTLDRDWETVLLKTI